MGTITKDVSQRIHQLDGDIDRYSDLAQKKPEVYRSLNKYIALRLKELNKEKKASLSVRLGVGDGTLNDWEQKGITETKQAFELAIALKLDADSVEDFIQKETGRGIYLADEEHFRYVYILQHREELEKKYPYEVGETVIQWTNRVKPLLQIEKDMHQGWKKTEEFKEALKMGNIEQTQRLPFREAGEKALVFLKEQIKGTPFGANYGNMDISYAQLDLGEKNKKAIKEKNVSLSRNIFFRREKKFFEYIVYQLVKGEVPHRNEMINLGMILRLNYEQMNDLLSLCGENTLYARNIYEGALLTVWKFLSEMRPEWFEEKESDLYDDDLENLEQKEKIFNRDYKVEVKLGGPIDFCVLASQQVERALTGLSEKEFKKILKEKPSWYLNSKEQRLRIEQKRLSTIFYEMMARMQMVRNRVIEQKCSYHVDDKIVEVWVSSGISIQIEYSLMNVMHDLKADYGYEDIDPEKDEELLRIMNEFNAKWMAAVKNEDLLSADANTFMKFKNNMLEKMEKQYDSYSAAYWEKLNTVKADETEEKTEDECNTVE